MGTKHRPNEVRKEQILEAAFFLFNKKGYHQAKMDDIVKKSKLSKGSIYRFYPSKEELFLNLFDYLVSKFEKEAEDLTHLSSRPKELLEGIIDVFLEHLRKRQNIFLADVKFWSMASRDKKFREKVNKLYERWTRRLERLFEDGKRKGEFPNTNPKTAAIAVIALFDGFILRIVGDPDLNIEEDVKPVLEHFKQCFF